MKKLVIALLTMAATSGAFAQPIVENHMFKSPIWASDDKDQSNKKTYGVLTANGGVEPIKFQIVKTQNAVVTLEEDVYGNYNQFTSMIIDCDKPASFQYIAIDAKNHKSAPATITLECGWTAEEVAATAEGKNRLE